MSLVLNYYGRKGKYERHLEHCSGVTGIFCNFDTQHLVTFEDNLQYKGNSHLLAYCHFEITVLTDSGSDPESKKSIAVSYVIIFVFHPELNLDCVTIERPFGHTYTCKLFNKRSLIIYKYQNTFSIKRLHNKC